MELIFGLLATSTMLAVLAVVVDRVVGFKGLTMTYVSHFEDQSWRQISGEIGRDDHRHL